jgi:hypothetical protein
MHAARHYSHIEALRGLGIRRTYCILIWLNTSGTGTGTLRTSMTETPPPASRAEYAADLSGWGNVSVGYTDNLTLVSSSMISLQARISTTAK